ncbi:hypothetical protein L915_01934 [Phytophthora nicotianae]|nr:hypothetical protein L915_01934 [Phytophthora nicotianae]
MEVDSLLRPRSNTSSEPETAKEPGAVLLPHRGGATSSNHALPPSNGGRWLPRLLLVGGAVYAVAMLAWSSQNLNVVRMGSDTAASESSVAFEQQVEEQQGGSSMDLAAMLKAANDQEADTQQEQERQQNTKETEEDTATFEVTPIPTQAAIDTPMEASQVREALHLAREAVVAKMDADGSMSLLLSASGSQMSDEVRRQQEAEELARDTLLLPKGEMKP